MHICRWFGVYTIFKGVAIGIALGTLTTPVGNSGFVFGVYALTFLVQLVTWPQMDVYACATEMYTAGVQVCTCACLRILPCVRVFV